MSPLITGLLLASIHAAIGIVWLGLLVVAATRASRWLRRPAVSRALEGITGVVLVGFGVRTALERT